jgi:hypothetical protein
MRGKELRSPFADPQIGRDVFLVNPEGFPKEDFGKVGLAKVFLKNPGHPV